MKSWDEIEHKYITPENASRVAAHEQRMLAEVRAHRLAELRHERELTQKDMAQVMGVAQSRVSRIEHGEIDRTEVSTLTSYVRALGGQLRLVADFGEQTLVT